MKRPMKIALCGSLIVVAAMTIGPVTRAGEPHTSQQPPLVLTLEKSITMALEQNRDILIADQDRYKADAQIGEARSGALPQINVTGLYTRNIKKPVLFLGPNTPFNSSDQTVTFELGSDNSYQVGAQFSQVLFNRQIGVAMDIANTYYEYRERSFQATQQEIVLLVKKSFYGILLAQKLVEANRQGLEVVKANYENVQLQHRFGNAAEYELLRAEVQLANTEPLLISAENNLLLAKNALKNLLAIPLDQEIELQGDFKFEEIPAASMYEARQNAITANPSIAQLSLQESILEKNISVERSNYFPTLSLVGSYQWQTQDNTFQFRNYTWARLFNVGVQISYPIFDGFRTSARTQEASIDREKIHYARLKAEEGLRIQIQSAELKMAEAQKRIEGQEKNISQARKAVSIAETRYKSGVGTQLELLDTQVAMTRAQTNYALAMYDFLVARAEWQYAVGLPNWAIRE